MCALSDCIFYIVGEDDSDNVEGAGIEGSFEVERVT
jgi:hypothetical protein